MTGAAYAGTPRIAQVREQGRDDGRVDVRYRRPRSIVEAVALAV